MEFQKLLKRKKKAIQEDNKLSIATISNEMGNWYNTHGKYEEALEEYKSEAEAYNVLGLRMENAKAHRMMAEMYMLISNFTDALTHEEIHLNTARSLNNKIEEQRALATIGRIHLLNGQSIAETNASTQPLKSAEKSFMKSLLLCESLKGKIPSHELMDMRARLLLNLGVTLEHLENYERSVEFMERAIAICVKQELYELLHQCYITEGLLYFHRYQDYAKALTFFNKSLDIAERLSDKVIRLCDSLCMKADVFISQDDLQSARQVLIKAWKLKNPNEDERSSIEKKLKIVACMCYTEDSLISIKVTNYENRKKLYEKLGDGYCFFKKYSKAITNYLHMLECAQLNNENGKDLIPIYVSLYQTYRDNKQYDLALDYYWKEYNLCSHIPKEAFNTLINISEVLELGQKSYQVMESIYLKARLEAQKIGRPSLEMLCLQKLIILKRKHNFISEAENLQKELDNLKNNYVNSDDSSDDETETLSENTPSIGDDICIEDLSDVYESDTSEDMDRPRNTRKHTRSLAVKKNSKGETQLHIACISGNTILVRRLLDQNHPVNIRDHAGWLPLHEACLYGFKEIVELLLDKGAHVNDRGGTKCDGITPLYDAASNGHLEVVDLLLNRGASAKLLTDEGESALDILVKWRESTQLDDSEELLYDSVYNKLSIASLKNADQRICTQLSNHKENDSCRSKRSTTTFKDNIENKNISKLPNTDTNIGNLRFSIDDFSDIENNSSVCDKRKNLPPSRDNDFSDIKMSISEKNDERIEKNARTEYQNVMKNLRTRNSDHFDDNVFTDKSKKRSALLDTNEVGEDWLEDDIIHTKSKRRKGAPRSQTNSTNCNTKELERSYSVDYMYSSDSSNNSVEVINDNSPINQGNSRLSLASKKSSNFQKSNCKTRRKRQMSLLDSGFSRETSMSPTWDIIGDRSNDKQIEPDSTTGRQSPSQFVSTSQINTFPVVPPIPVKVRVEDRLLVVPIVANLIDSLNIAWLSKETSKRYYNIVGLEPCLSLTTPDGALLSSDDPLSLVLGVSELQSQVLKWNLPPLHERYIEACGHLTAVVDNHLLSCLNACQATQILKLSNLSLSNVQLQPVFRSINHQANLQTLDIRNNFMTDEGFRSLCSSLPTLKQLKTLNLSGNHLTYMSLSCLSDLLNQKTCLMELEEFNFGFNPLGDESWKYLSIILNKLDLSKLIISSCDLQNYHQTLSFNFKKLVHINLGFNDIEVDCFSNLSSFFNGDIIEYINLENIRYIGKKLIKLLVDFLTRSSLKNLRILNLSGCEVTDSDIVEILRPLLKAEKFETFVLANNNDLSSISFRRLMQHRPCIKNIYLEGCLNITKYLAASNVYEDIDHVAPESIRLSIDNGSEENTEKLNIVKNLWTKLWGEQAIIKPGPFGLIYLMRK